MPQRPPFDPRRIIPPEPTPSRADAPQDLLTPKSVNEMVRGAIAARVPSTLRVLGEIGNITRPRSGHVYFSLKDAASELSCVMWRSSADKLKFKPEPGMEVVAVGGLDVYTPRGTYQLIVRKLEPRGVGALEIEFRRLKERLEREGLFDPARKKSLPKIPRRIAVVTSPSGAAVRDILRTLDRRFPVCDILIYPVRVQGEGAAAEIAEAVNRLDRASESLGGVDVIIVGRGGGSLEDLWAFNEEIVARAVAACCIPIVSAVGHETDMSISDMVADVRAATPTAAAEIVAPRLLDLIENLNRQSTRARRVVVHAAELARHQVNALCAAESLARPLNRLRERAQTLDERERRVLHALNELGARSGERLRRAELAVLRFGAGERFARAGQKLEQVGYRVRELLERRLYAGERRFNDLWTRLQRAHDRRPLTACAERVRQSEQRVMRAVRYALERCEKKLDARLDQLRACDPRSVLHRGYSITRDARTRRVISSIENVKDNMRIVTELSDGEFKSTAEDPRQPNLFD